MCGITSMLGPVLSLDVQTLLGTVERDRRALEGFLGHFTIGITRHLVQYAGLARYYSGMNSFHDFKSLLQRPLVLG